MKREKQCWRRMACVLASTVYSVNIVFFIIHMFVAPHACARWQQNAMARSFCLNLLFRRYIIAIKQIFLCKKKNEEITHRYLTNTKKKHCWFSLWNKNIFLWQKLFNTNRKKCMEFRGCFELSRAGKLTDCDGQTVCANKLRVKSNCGSNKEDWSPVESRRIEPWKRAQSNENRFSKIKILKATQMQFKSNFNGRNQWGTTEQINKQKIASEYNQMREQRHAIAEQWLFICVETMAIPLIKQSIFDLKKNFSTKARKKCNGFYSGRAVQLSYDARRVINVSRY